MDYSLLIGQILVLSDQTMVQNVPWSMLKEFAMADNYQTKDNWFDTLTEDE